MKPFFRFALLTLKQFSFAALSVLAQWGIESAHQWACRLLLY